MIERGETTWLLWWTERGGVAQCGWAECEERRREEKTRSWAMRKHGMKRKKRATVCFCSRKEDTGRFKKTRTFLVRHGHEF